MARRHRDGVTAMTARGSSEPSWTLPEGLAPSPLAAPTYHGGDTWPTQPRARTGACDWDCACVWDGVCVREPSAQAEVCVLEPDGVCIRSGVCVREPSAQAAVCVLEPSAEAGLRDAERGLKPGVRVADVLKRAPSSSRSPHTPETCRDSGSTSAAGSPIEGKRHACCCCGKGSSPLGKSGRLSSGVGGSLADKSITCSGVDEVSTPLDKSGRLSSGVGGSLAGAST
eukprot:scaffold1245_cov122-Isochrysis_galbana.AAC.3